MALSHSKVKKQSEIPIDRKEDDPRRINMSKAQAVAANELLRKDKQERITFVEEQRRKREEKMKTILGKKNDKIPEPVVEEDDDEDDAPVTADQAEDPAPGLQHGNKKGKKGK